MRPPSEPKKGESIRAKISEMIRYMRATTITSVSGGKLSQSSNGAVIEIPRGRSPMTSTDTLPPFTVSLIAVPGESPSYAVTVTPGRVTDRVPGDQGDAVISYEPGNLRYTANNPSATPPEVLGEPRRFAITVGDSVCVKVEVLPTGAIGKESTAETEWVKIEIGSGTEIESIHYIPAVADDDEGTPGTYYYQLAKLESTDTGAKLTPIMAGSHIDHYRERPILDNVGYGDANVIKDYHAETDTYRFRSLKGTNGITVTQNADDIEISGGDGGHLDLFCVTNYVEIEDGFIKWAGVSGDTHLHRWRGGLYLGLFPLNTGPLQGDENITVNVQYTTYLDFSP